MVSAARRAGDFSILYPKGVKRMQDVPWPLQEAINQGLTILSWFENYVPEELPPENLWDDGEAIEEHFNVLRAKKEAEREGYGSGGGEDYDEMQGNDLSSVFKQ